MVSNLAVAGVGIVDGLARSFRWSVVVGVALEEPVGEPVEGLLEIRRRRTHCVLPEPPRRR